MPQSLSNILLHLVFSSKDRHPWFEKGIREKSQTFQDEYRALLNKYGIEYDERYVWD